MIDPEGRDAQPKPRRRSAFGRILDILSGAVRFALVNAAVTMAIIVWSLRIDEIAWTGRTALLLAVFTLAGSVGGLVAWSLAALIAGSRVATARFATLFALLPVTFVAVLWASTLTLTLLDVGLGGHPPLSRAFAVDMLYRMATAAYIVVVSGLPLMMPAAVAQLLVSAFVFARRPRG